MARRRPAFGATCNGLVFLIGPLRFARVERLYGKGDKQFFQCVVVCPKVRDRDYLEIPFAVKGYLMREFADVPSSGVFSISFINANKFRRLSVLRQAIKAIHSGRDRIITVRVSVLLKHILPFPVFKPIEIPTVSVVSANSLSLPLALPHSHHRGINNTSVP